MDESSRLRPRFIKMQCERAIKVMDDDNESLGIVESRLERFAANNNLTSESFEGLKDHMADYKLLISSMRTANGEDKSDYEALQQGVKNEDLDGSLILEQNSRAEEGERIAEGKLVYYRELQKSRWNTMGIQQDFTYEINLYRQMANTWRDIQKECEKKIKKYDEIESQTARLCVVGNLMRRDIMAGLRSFGVTGKYPKREYAMWRVKLQDAGIMRMRRYLLENMAVTGKQLQHMEEIGYLPKEIKKILDTCETAEEKEFFRCLMSGTEESYKQAFQYDPNKISEFMMAIAADYAIRIFEVDAEGNLTAKGKKAFEAFNNAILSANKVYMYDMGNNMEEMSPFLYRDIYMDQIYAYTKSHATGLAWELGGMAEDSSEYKLRRQEIDKVVALTNFWASEILLKDDLNRFTGETVDMKVEITNYGLANIEFELSHYSSMQGKRVKEKVTTNALWFPNTLDNQWSNERLQKLEERKENIMLNAAASFLEAASLGALSVIAPEMAMVVGVIYMGMGMEAAPIPNADIAVDSTKGKVIVNSLNEGLPELINGFIEWVDTSKELTDAQWQAKMEWFGAGGDYNASYSSELYGRNDPAVIQSNIYDPDVIRGMIRWEKEGIAGWIGWEDDAITKDMAKDIKGYLPVYCKSDAQQIEECLALLNGGYEIIELQDTERFSKNIEAIQLAYQDALSQRYKERGLSDKDIAAKDFSINIQDEWREYIK